MTIEPGESFPQSDFEAARRRTFVWEHNPPNQATYYEDKADEMLTGEITWMVRDLSEQYGRIYDLVYKTKYIGYLDARTGIDVLGYIPTTSDHPMSITIPGDDFFEVLDMMEAYAVERLGLIARQNEG